MTLHDLLAEYQWALKDWGDCKKELEHAQSSVLTKKPITDYWTWRCEQSALEVQQRLNCFLEAKPDDAPAGPPLS